MKLSFSLSTKPSSKQHQTTLKPTQTFNTQNQSSPTKEFLTEFDSSRPSNSQSKKLIIPPKPNEWRPHKKMKNLDLPIKSDDPNLQFEVVPSSIAESDDPNISFGLNLRQSVKKIQDLDTLLETNQNPDLKIENFGTQLKTNPNPDHNMLQKFKEDLSRLPEDRGFEEFDEVPVEGFGAALLAGYGWYEGRGIGKNAKEDVKVVQYERRTAKEGLGFVADVSMLPPKTHNGKSGKLEKDGFGVGKDVRIVGGRDMGLKGRVEVMGDGGFVVLRLLKSEEEVRVRVRVSDIAELGSVEEERCLKKLKELKIRGSNSNEANRDKRKVDKVDRREKLGTSSKVCWLTSHIRVRVISKDLKGGKLYLKKGKVVDVVGPMKCDISMDDSGMLIQGVDQELLETALPRRGGPVLVLYGRKKGVYGNLVEKDMENETGVVRDADTHALVNVKLEQIAEYIGDPSDIGY